MVMGMVAMHTTTPSTAATTPAPAAHPPGASSPNNLNTPSINLSLLRATLQHGNAIRIGASTYRQSQANKIHHVNVNRLRLVREYAFSNLISVLRTGHIPEISLPFEEFGAVVLQNRAPLRPHLFSFLPLSLSLSLPRAQRRTRHKTHAPSATSNAVNPHLLMERRHRQSARQQKKRVSPRRAAGAAAPRGYVYIYTLDYIRYGVGAAINGSSCSNYSAPLLLLQGSYPYLSTNVPSVPASKSSLM